MSQQLESKDVTFADAKGTEANQHAKKLAKKESESKKNKKKSFPVYFTKKGSKILKVTIKPNGVYQEYIGNTAKKNEADFLKNQITIWIKDNLWIDEYHIVIAKKLVQEKGMLLADAIKYVLDPSNKDKI